MRRFADGRTRPGRGRAPPTSAKHASQTRRLLAVLTLARSVLIATVTAVAVITKDSDGRATAVTIVPVLRDARHPTRRDGALEAR